jgi:L-ascorbate metabolism protein UlaG (beta-lactamase superfamily)
VRDAKVARALSLTVSALLAPTPPAPVHAAQPYRRDARLAATWIGHATVLLQLDDKVVLTDPVFTARVGGLSPRLVAPGLRACELPPVDVALISHMHLDHLSYGSLSLIASRTRTLILPAGGLDYVHAYSFEEVELGRWQSWEHDGLKVTAVPVKHPGWRWAIDALWRPQSFTGYVIEYRGQRVFFGGDTALDEADFAEVRRRFPSLDLAILPIAPVQPREFMKRTHMDPAEAVRAFQLLGAKAMLPIHFDTFINSTDAPGDAPRLLDDAAAKAGIAAQVARLQIGEQRVFVRR